MMGVPKQKESLSGLLSSSSILGHKLGRIDVRFQTPYSLRDTISEQMARRNSSGDHLFDIEKNENDKMVFLRYLGFKLLSDINCKSNLNLLVRWTETERSCFIATSVAMPSALVATALLTTRTTRVSASLMVESRC